MKNTTPPMEPPPEPPADNQSPVQPAPVMVMPKKMSKRSFFLVFVLLPILLVAGIVPAVLNSQTFLSRAAGAKCRLITKVAINPGKIVTYIISPPTNLSVLAYDYYNSPIFSGVQYEWGMSSTNSIGTVNAKRDLASFTPLRAGTGDLYVKAKNSCTQKAVIGSIKVTVQTAKPSQSPPGPGI